MPAYHYIALSQDQKELSGVIEAPDEQLARKKLNELGLAVVSMNVVGAASGTTSVSPMSAPPAGKLTFEFEAFDKNGKKVVGTIVSDDAVRAYARLFGEYQLNVLSLVAANLSPTEKEAGRKLGILTLQKEYEKLYGKKKASVDEAQAAAEAQNKERKELLEKIDFTMGKIETFLKDYGADVKPEERDIIQGYINQLIRIKDSTNLDHIRATCEKMLTHIQKQEIFVHEEQRFRESSKLKVETKELLSQLKRTGLQQEIDIVKTASRWREYPLLQPIANAILRFFKSQSPEILRLRDEIKMVNRHIRAYLIILITGKTKIQRLEAWESIKTLREEKKRLALQIEALRQEEKKKLEASQPESLFWDQTGAALGWVLAFYLLSYIVAYPFTVKQFNLPPLPKSFYFYVTSLPKAFTLLLFLSYAAVTLRNFWLRRRPGVTALLYPLTLFTFLLIVINLM